MPVLNKPAIHRGTIVKHDSLGSECLGKAWTTTRDDKNTNNEDDRNEDDEEEEEDEDQ